MIHKVIISLAILMTTVNANDFRSIDLIGSKKSILGFDFQSINEISKRRYVKIKARKIKLPKSRSRGRSTRRK